MGRLEVGSQKRIDLGDQLQETRAAAASDVVHFTACLGGGGGSEIGLNRVGHIGEVPGLLAVAVDDRASAGEHRFEKQRNDRCIRTVGRLTRAEDIEVSQPNRFQPVNLGESRQ